MCMFVLVCLGMYVIIHVYMNVGDVCIYVLGTYIHIYACMYLHTPT